VAIAGDLVAIAIADDFAADERFGAEVHAPIEVGRERRILLARRIAAVRLRGRGGPASHRGAEEVRLRAHARRRTLTLSVSISAV
jgi:hypothetical protein